LSNLFLVGDAAKTCHPERSAARNPFQSMLNVAKSKDPENAYPTDAVSRRSHETD